MTSGSNIAIMPKIKKGRRHHHYQPKCAERRWQSKIKQTPLQVVTNTIQNTQCQDQRTAIVTKTRAETSSSDDITSSPERDHPSSQFDHVKATMPPELSGWHVYMDNKIIQLSLISCSLSEPSVVKITLTVQKNLQWTVYVYGHLLRSDHDIICKYPGFIQSGQDIQNICDTLQQSNVCKGNDEPEFIDLLVSRGGVITNHTSTTAYLDKTNNTIRHTNCALLCDGKNKCGTCQKYRSTLRAMKSRKESSSMSKVASNSHINYRYLQSEELKDRLKNIQRSKKNVKRQNDRLIEKLNKVIGSEGIELLEDDEHEIEELFSHVDKDIERNHNREHFQRIFWEQQRDYNKLKNKRSMKWHPLMIRFALNLRYLSSTAYRSIGNFLALPSQRTLRDYTHVLSFDAGVSGEVVNRLKVDMNFEQCSSSQKKVTVLLDEMKIKSGLVFNKSTGRLIGFVNLGDVNRDLEILQLTLNEANHQSKQPQLADSMLVMMVRPIFKPSFTFPVAQYPTTHLSGEKLYPIVWDVIEALEFNDIQVCSVSCDGLSANRKFFRISKDPDDKLSVPFKTTNPFDRSRSIYFFCDVPHLLKTARNCFSNSFSHKNSRHLQVYFMYVHAHTQFVFPRQHELTRVFSKNFVIIPLCGLLISIPPIIDCNYQLQDV